MDPLIDTDLTPSLSRCNPTAHEAMVYIGRGIEPFKAGGMGDRARGDATDFQVVGWKLDGFGCSCG